MNLETETALIQNPALGAIILWSFVNSFDRETRYSRGPELPFLMPLLPMTFHDETVKALQGRIREGGLDLALSQNRTFTLDLQQRMEMMVEQTMRALNVALACGLVSYDRRSIQIRSSRRTPPLQFSSLEVRQMLKTARRLGYWFSTMNPERICFSLQIQF